MTLDELQAVCELAKTHSMSACAVNLHMTKANVSRLVSNFETELGATLFVKSRKGSYPTPMGERVCAIAQDILERCDKLGNVRDECEDCAAPLEIAFTESDEKAAREILATMKSKRKIEVVRLTASPDPHSLKLKGRSIDIVLGTIQRSGLEAISVYKNRFIGYCIAESPLSIAIKAGSQTGNGKISVKRLADFTLIAPSSIDLEEAPSASRFSRYLESNGIASKTNVIECNSIVTMRHLLGSNNTAFISDECGIRSIFEEEITAESVRILNIEPIEPIIRYIALRKDSPYYHAISDAISTLYNMSTSNFERFERIL